MEHQHTSVVRHMSAVFLSLAFFFGTIVRGLCVSHLLIALILKKEKTRHQRWKEKTLHSAALSLEKRGGGGCYTHWRWYHIVLLKTILSSMCDRTKVNVSLKGYRQNWQGSGPRMQKKNGKKKCPFLSLFRPLSSTLLPRGENYFFSSKKNPKWKKKTQWYTRNVFTSCGEGHQTCAAMTKGLPYNSSTNGDQWFLENYAHGRASYAEGWHKNLPSLWFQLFRTERLWKRCNSSNHLQSTLSAIHRLSRNWRRGTHMSRSKTKRWSRDPWVVGNLTIRDDQTVNQLLSTNYNKWHFHRLLKHAHKSIIQLYLQNVTL